MAATFLAILAGMVGGGVAMAEASSPAIVAALVMAIAVACWLSARFIPSTGSGAPDLVVTPNPWTSTMALLKSLKAEQRMWDGMLIVSWFWLVGAVVVTLLP